MNADNGGSVFYRFMPLAQRPLIRRPRGALDVPLTWGGVALRRDERSAN